jgi:hypothetical protein
VAQWDGWRNMEARMEVAGFLMAVGEGEKKRGVCGSEQLATAH